MHFQSSEGDIDVGADASTEEEVASLLPLTQEQIQQVAVALYATEGHAELLRKQVQKELERQQNKDDVATTTTIASHIGNQENQNGGTSTSKKNLKVSFCSPLDAKDEFCNIDSIEGTKRTQMEFIEDEETQKLTPLPLDDMRHADSYPTLDSSTKEIHALRQEVRALEIQVSHLQGLGSSNRRFSFRPTRLGRSMFSRTFRAVVGGSPPSGGDENNEFTTGLDEDTFSLMMLSEPCSQSWMLGISALTFQLVLGTFIAIDQIGESVDSSSFNVPFKVDPVVRFGQCLSIILCLSTQSDVLTAVQTLVILHRSDEWYNIIGENEYSRTLWIRRVVLPNTLKVIQGVLVIFICFVIIIQSDDIITLLKDFTALMVLSETDNVLFYLAQYGYLGRNLQDKTIELSKIEIEDSAYDSTQRRKDLFVRSSVLLVLICWLFGWWVQVALRQSNGVYFSQRYKKCLDENNESLYPLAKTEFGDGNCYGGPLNTLSCDFEGGDCINFNLAYPLCKRSDLINVETLIGDGTCNEEFMIFECDFDGGDCCPYSITKKDYFGDGQCNGGKVSTEKCGYDNGDCREFRRRFPKCPLDDLADVIESGSIVLGDGICSSGIYSSEECGYEDGDCHVGQQGSDLIFDDVVLGGEIIFDFDLSSDGKNLVVGLPNQGMVKVFKYDPFKKVWIQISKSIFTTHQNSFFGFSVAFGSSTGHQIAVASPSYTGILELQGKVQSFQHDSTSNEWSQIGQDIEGEAKGDIFGWKIDISKDGLRLAIAAPLNDDGGASAGYIRIYEQQSDLGWVQLGGDIDGGVSEEVGRYNLQLSSVDDKRVMASARIDGDTVIRLYEFNKIFKDWTQLGDDLSAPFSKTSVISGDGSRVAISSHSNREKSTSGQFQVFAPGQVQVFDYNNTENTWDQVGDTIFAKGDDNYEGNGFGYSLAMSSDGTQLAIGAIKPGCGSDPLSCASGKVFLFIYNKISKSFVEPIPKFASFEFIEERERDRKSSFFGRKLAFGNDNGSSFLAIQGYNAEKDHGFVRVFDVKDIIYPRCLINPNDSKYLNDGLCDEKYNTEECEFDGGDCT